MYVFYSLTNKEINTFAKNNQIRKIKMMELNKKLKEVLDKLKEFEGKILKTEKSKEFGGMNSKMVCMSEFVKIICCS